MPDPIQPAKKAAKKAAVKVATKVAKPVASVPTPATGFRPGDTYVATLENGESHTFLDGGKTYKFLKGIPVGVPTHVKEALEAKAVDHMTQSLGNKVSGVDVQKFKFTAIPASSQVAPVDEQEQEEEEEEEEEQEAGE